MKKILIYLFAFLCGLFFTLQGYAQSTNAYIEKYKSLAINEMIRTGVPAAISLAQGIVESGSGTSWLSLNANNQFGIKCKNDWQGERIFHDDDRRNECFRKYESAAASWRDHSDFLKSSPRYSFLFYLDPLDYKAWAYGLKQAGYATSNSYARKLIATIQKYKLNRYSQQGLALSKQEKQEKPQNEFAAMLDKKVQLGRPQKKTPATDSAGSDRKTDASYPQNLFQINKRAVLFLPAGTQLITIANRFDVPLRRLVRYNELHSDVLPENMLIFVEKKRKKGDHVSHIVQAGESWHEIAQEEGIRLKWLLKRNHQTIDSPLQPGTALVLKGYAEGTGETVRRESGGFFGWLARLFNGDGKKNVSVPPVENTINASKNMYGQAPSSPSRGNSTFVYEVKSGDTLYGIAQKFNANMDDIRRLNHIEGSLIKVGQKLQIPGK